MTEIVYPGGEMDGWSDPVPKDDVVVAHVARMISDDARSVLLVGARAAALAAQLLADGREVTAVVRGTIDAERLAHGGAAGVCGSLDRWHPEQPVDLVVALESPGDLLPPLDEGINALDLVARLRDWAARSVLYVANGAGLPSLQQQITPPRGKRDFASLGRHYDLRPPTLSELGESPTAACFDGAVVARDAITSHSASTTTLLRSLLARDLRQGALMSDPLTHADGWLLCTGLTTPAVTYRNLDGNLATRLPEAVGIPLETTLRHVLMTGDLVRLRHALREYSGWLRTAPGSLPRNVAHADSGLAVIDRSVAQQVSLAVAMLDLAAALDQPGAQPFGVELHRDDVAAELLRFADDVVDPTAEIAAAAAAYDVAPFARAAVRADPASDVLKDELRGKDAQIAALRADLAKDRRHLRALEHALNTESGPRAKRAYYMMTAPTKRFTEAARRRMNRG